MRPLAAGDPAQVAGYRLRSRLGAGGMGVVYLAYTPGGHPVALKVVRPELGDDAEFRRRFRQEVEAARKVTGLYTAQLIDADPDGTPPWLVTAYVPGPSLAEAVAAHGPMPQHTVLVLMAGVAEALAAIHHAGIVHRDLKPSNVLLAADGPKVIDFGIARALEATALTRTGMSVGSPQFISPDQLRGGVVTAAADMFALGGTACYAATGRPPFGDGDAASLLYRVMHDEPDLAGCPPALAPVIAACLAKEPSARPAPGQLIDACRAQASPAVAFGDSWLPPAITADLAQHAPSAAPGPPTPVPGTAPAAGLAGLGLAAAAAAAAGPDEAGPGAAGLAAASGPGADEGSGPGGGPVPTVLAGPGQAPTPPALASTGGQPPLAPPGGQPAYTWPQGPHSAEPSPYGPPSASTGPQAPYGGPPSASTAPRQQVPFGQPQPPGQQWGPPPPGWQPPPWQQGQQPPARSPWRRLWPVLTAAAVVIVGLASYLIATSGQSPAASTGPVASGPSAGRTPGPVASQSLAPASAASPAAGQTPQPAASTAPKPPPSPTPASTLDACLVGTWDGGAIVNPATINGSSINLTGPHGPADTFNANGTGSVVSTASDKLSGTYQGVPLTVILIGTQQFTWHTSNGALAMTYGAATGTTTLYNASTGKQLGSEAYHENPGGASYSCTSSTLRIADTSDDGTETLTRS